MPGFTPFTDNYSDLSDGRGYQFEFRCDICGSGYRSSVAVSLLQKQGFRNLVNVQGGMSAWNAAGRPMVNGWGDRPAEEAELIRRAA